MTLYYQDNYGDGALKVRFESYQIDDSDEGGSGNRTLDLTTYSESTWSELRLTGSVTLSDEIDGLFPDEERSDPPVELLVAVDCPDTHHRYGIFPHGFGAETRESNFEVTISRDWGYGTVRLTPYLIRTEDATDHSSDYATYEGQRVADGRAGRILLDDLGQNRGGMMDVRFESFAETEIPDENVYHLHRTAGDVPQVWINEDHQLIAGVLDTGGHTGFRPLLRKTLAPWIAMDIKKELVLWAIIGAEDGDIDEPWQNRILDEFGPDLYESTQADEPSDLYGIFRGEQGDDPHYLVNEIGKIMQRKSNVAVPLTTFIERQGPDYLRTEDD